MTNEITLTDDQNEALIKFSAFLLDPNESVFVLSGYSGTGKSTLVKTLIERLPAYMKAGQLINADMPDYGTAFTATTNKAAETFAMITKQEVKTIHSYLGLRVAKDFKTGATELVISDGAQGKYQEIIFIDEASYIDSKLLTIIFQQVRDCKVVFIGDPAQLTPVKSSSTPVFNSGFKGAQLTKVVRQAEGNPIIDLGTMFRNTVNTGEFFSFKPDGNVVQYLDQSDFEDAIVDEFTRPDWKHNDARVLAWRNESVLAYNHAINNKVKNTPDFQVGDYAVCNKYVQLSRHTIKTDQMVCITEIEDLAQNEYGVMGRYVTLDYGVRVFWPVSLQAKNEFIKQAKATENYRQMRIAENEWIDLRAAYACTINKSQGSTYDRVFIDLNDVRRCNSGDQIARMLYVAVTRARHQVFLTGDLV